MDIIFKCSKCGQDLEIDAAGAGLEVSCPKCNAALLVPHASSAPPGQLKDTIRLSPFPQLPSQPPPATRPARPAPPPPAPSGALYTLPRSAAAPSVPSTPPATERRSSLANQPVRAVITDFDMPMAEMMKHALKWMVAALPAVVILLLLAAVIFKLLGVIVRP